jgi:hypothetical protein
MACCPPTPDQVRGRLPPRGGSTSAFEASAEPDHIPTIDDQNPIHLNPSISGEGSALPDPPPARPRKGREKKAVQIDDPDHPTGAGIDNHALVIDDRVAMFGVGGTGRSSTVGGSGSPTTTSPALSPTERVHPGPR